MIIKENFELKNLCTFSIGGKAKLLCLVKNKEDLLEAIKLANAHELKFHIHGGGSNTLYSDKDLDLVIIKMNNIGVTLNLDRNEITVLSGTPWSFLQNYCLKNALFGLEPLMGIPGTIGGAVFGNAGAHGMEIKDALTEIECYNTKTEKFEYIDLKSFEFSYRYSDFKKNPHLIIWSVKLKISAKTIDCKGDLEEFRNFRLEKQPQGKTTGSYFKNPTNDSAGRLIEAVGLKGHQIGGIKSSEKHANFFINFNNASFKDVKNLENLIKKRVKEQFNIDLKTEVITVE